MLGILILLLALIIYYWLNFEWSIRHTKYKSKSIPAPPMLQIVGNMIQISQEGFLEYLLKCVQKYGPTFKLQMIKNCSIIITHPDDIQILLRSTTNINKTIFVQQYTSEWFGTGLLSSSEHDWKFQRKLIQPTFHIHLLEKFLKTFEKHSKILVDELRKKSSEESDLDVYPFLKTFCFDVLCDTTAGWEANVRREYEECENASSIKWIDIGASVKITSIIALAPFVFPFTKIGRLYEKALKIFNDFSHLLIIRRRDELLNNRQLKGGANEMQEETKKHLIPLDLLLHGRRSGESLTNKEIKDQVKTLITAGSDTLPTALSYVLFLLSRHPIVQDNVYREQYEILQDKNEEPTLNHIRDMRYLECVIKEALRLYPPVPIISREIKYEFQLKTSNYLIPAKSNVVVGIHALHRDPNLYPDPEKFDPERFFPENIVKRHPYSFIPFSFGPRNCIGTKYAMLNMKTSLSKIIRNFKILPAYDKNGEYFEMDLLLSLTLKPLNGVRVRLIPRD